jgi:hypothetical protein
MFGTLLSKAGPDLLRGAYFAVGTLVTSAVAAKITNLVKNHSDQSDQDVDAVSA